MTSSDNADRRSWPQVLPMPPQKKQLAFELYFSPEEYRLIQKGLIPQGMDDKWFIFLEDDWCYFHRSWAGACIYQMRLALSGQGFKATEVWVNRDREEYQWDKWGEDEIYEAEFLGWLIDYFILKKDVEPPRPNIQF